MDVCRNFISEQKYMVGSWEFKYFSNLLHQVKFISFIFESFWVLDGYRGGLRNVQQTLWQQLQDGGGGAGGRHRVGEVWGEHGVARAVRWRCGGPEHQLVTNKYRSIYILYSQVEPTSWVFVLPVEMACLSSACVTLMTFPCSSDLHLSVLFTSLFSNMGCLH